MHDYAQPDSVSDGGLANGVQVRCWLESARVSFAGWRSLLLAWVAAAVILIIDDVLFGYPLPLRVTAPLDEVAHAAAMVVVLSPLARRVPLAFVAGSLISAVMLNVDRVAPACLGADARAPVLTFGGDVAALALLMDLPRRWKWSALGWSRIEDMGVGMYRGDCSVCVPRSLAV